MYKDVVFSLSLYTHIYIRRPLQSVERVRLLLLALNIHSFLDISPASLGSQAADIEESYPPGTQAAGVQDLGARMLESRNLISLLLLKTRHSAATGWHRAPTFWPQNPANLPKRRVHRSAKWLI